MSTQQEVTAPGDQQQRAEDQPDAVETAQTPAFLEVVFGPDKGARHQIGSDDVLVGRSGECDMVLSDPLASKRHVLVSSGNGTFRIKDLASLNGTKYQGVKNPEFVISPGELFELGTTVMALRPGLSGADKRPRLSGSMSATQPMEAVRPDMPLPPGLEPMGARASERAVIPSQLVARIVSWLVIAVAASGGILLAMELTESALSSSPGSWIPDRKLGEDAGATQPARNLKRIARRMAETRPGTFMAENPEVTDSRDVAENLFSKGLEHENAGRMTEALEAYSEVQSKYPEFVPRDGMPVAERADRLNRTLQNKKIIEQARKVLDSKSLDTAALESTIAELQMIPASDGEFGDEAVRLADRARSKLKQLKMGIVGTPPQSDGKTTSPQETPIDPKTKTGEPQTDWESKAKKKYRSAQFKEASEILRQASSTLPDGPEKMKAVRLHNAVSAMEDPYREGLALIQKPGKELKAIELLKKARSLDANSFKLYGKQLDKEMSLAFVRLSIRSLEDKKYAEAREFYDKAVALDPQSEKVAKLSSLLEFTASDLTAKAASAKKPEDASRLLKDALAIAGKGGPAAKEAAKALQALDAVKVDSMPDGQGTAGQ